MKNVTKGILLFIVIAVPIAFSIQACKSGKDAKQATEDSIQAKMTADSMNASQNMNNSASQNTYTTGKGKVNPAKKNGKGMVVLQSDKAADEAYTNMVIEQDAQGIYNRAEIKPTYPGGEAALAKFIQDNIVYPDPALDNGVEADVNVVFAVDENGKVYTPMVKGERTGYGLDEAATNVVSKMPRWNPGQIKGKNVKSYYNLPISFKIN